MKSESYKDKLTKFQNQSIVDLFEMHFFPQKWL